MAPQKSQNSIRQHAIRQHIIRRDTLRTVVQQRQVTRDQSLSSDGHQRCERLRAHRFLNDFGTQFAESNRVIHTSVSQTSAEDFAAKGADSRSSRQPEITSLNSFCSTSLSFALPQVEMRVSTADRAAQFSRPGPI